MSLFQYCQSKPACHVMSFFSMCSLLYPSYLIPNPANTNVSTNLGFSVPPLAVLVGRNAGFPLHEPCRHAGIRFWPCLSLISRWEGENSLVVLPIEIAPQLAISQTHSRSIKV